VTAPDSYTARGPALTGAAVESASAADSVERATKLLQGKRLTVSIPNENQTDSDIEHRIDFCPRARAFVRSTFDSGQTFQRSRGRWRVASAGIRRGVGWVNVRFDPGKRTAKLVIDRRGVRFLGHRAELTSSPRCSAGASWRITWATA
jgi:hypothetical protein